MDGDRKGQTASSSINRSPPIPDIPWNEHVLRNWRVFEHTLRNHYIYTLLIFLPVGILAGALDLKPLAVFIPNLLAIVPLAMLLSFVTDELSTNLRQSLGALLNATFGNAVEFIVSYRIFLHSYSLFRSHS